MWVKPRLHTHRKCRLRFLLQLHTAYIRDYWSAPLSKDIFSWYCQVRRPITTPDCSPVKERKSRLSCATGARNQLSNLSLSTIKNSPLYQMLVTHTAFYLSSYILPRDPQGRLRSIKLLNRTVPCELVGDFFSSYSSRSRDSMCRVVISFNAFWPFHTNRDVVLTVCRAFRAHTKVFLWPCIRLNFINRNQDGMHLSLKNGSTFS